MRLRCACRRGDGSDSFSEESGLPAERTERGDARGPEREGHGDGDEQAREGEGETEERKGFGVHG